MSNHEHHEHHEHHGHSHSHDFSGTEDRNLILLRYMYDHNNHHSEELDELIEAMRAEGRAEAADLISAAKEAYRKGNELLHEAIHKYTEV